MKTWDHFGQSLFLSILVVIGFVFQGLVSATSMCSNSFRFDQLCPDPRLGPERDHGKSHGSITDTKINLESRRAADPSYSSYASAMIMKEPSMTSSCDFHRNGIETAVVRAVHMTENPNDFRHANVCNHIVKFFHDPYDETVGGSRGDSGRNNNPTWTSKVVGGTRKSIKICETELGIRRYINNDAVHVDSHVLAQDEEVMNKMSVYFWHNFTLTSNSANFVDAITNYYLSREEIACAKAPEYVQIVIVVSKSGRCEIIVQQYKIEKKRSPFGCGETNQRIPFPIPFCGSYECSQINLIIPTLKLSPRRDISHETHKHRHDNERQGSDKDHDYEGGETTVVPSSYDQDQNLPPCKPETEGQQSQAETTVLTNNDDEEKGSGPIDWREPIFLCAFPLLGIVFILLILNILRSRSARLEICRGYPTPRHSHSAYDGSFHSIEKNSLPM